MTSTTRRIVTARLALGLALAPALPILLAPAAVAAPTHASHVIKVKDDGKTNKRHPSLHVGDSYVITYKECATCGYSWQVVKRANNAVIKGSSVAKGPSSGGNPPVVGGVGTRTYTFKAKGVGTTTVKLGYFGPGASKPARTVTIAFTVTKA
ncbi:MAG TPA: protease inhibitor I42 family protein [Mycobacteriales bacterium]|nr:protease inhibitor I42 family protein [Mycobacteriales bacterium]